MAKQTPIDYLLKHESIVLSAYRKNDKKPKKTWESIIKQLPALNGVMSAATFRQYITVFATIIETLDVVRQDSEKILQWANALEVENTSLKNELEGQQQELDRARQVLKAPPPKPPAGNTHTAFRTFPGRFVQSLYRTRCGAVVMTIKDLPQR